MSLKKTLTCLVLTVGAYPGLAQGLPQKSDLKQGLWNSQAVTQELEQVLNLLENDLMKGLQGFDTDWGTLIAQKALDEVMKGVAEATVFAVPAAEIMQAYQKTKDEKLATELQKLRAIAKDGLSRLQKVKYQTLKTRYERKEALSISPQMISSSLRSQNATQIANELYGDRSRVLMEFDKLGDVLQEAYDSQLGYNGQRNNMDYDLALTANKLVTDQALQRKLDMINRSGTRAISQGNNQEIVQISPYERMMLQRQVEKEASDNQKRLAQMRADVRAALQYQLAKKARQQYDQKMNLPTQSVR